MTSFLRVSFGVSLLVLLAFLGFQQHQVIENQKAQMLQQFHSDQIALKAFMGTSGIVALRTSQDYTLLSSKDRHGLGLIIQRLIVARRIQNSFSDEQWEMLLKDARATMKLPLLQKHWERMKHWYSEEERLFVDEIIAS